MGRRVLAKALGVAVSLGLTTLGATMLGDPGPGDRIVALYGELKTAQRVAIVVPGADSRARNFYRRAGKTYGSPAGGAKAVLEEARRVDPSARLAVLAWLGYDSPPTIGWRSLTDGAAVAGAAELRRAVAELRARNGTAPITLLCHSYGSVVCAKALPGLPVDDVVVYGSPGLGVSRASQLGSAARLWAGRASDDWIRFVPPIRIAGVGFGTDPTDPRFGARVFDAGDGGHGDYLKPSGISLRNITLIVLGRHGEVTRAR
jgi:hypothetical protein